jgi:alcohol dehydrogenase
MQLGAAYAGLAIENSMLGASHALANPLTAVYGIPHGQAVGTMLPHVVEFNGQAFGHQYRDLLGPTAVETELDSDPSELKSSAQLLAQQITHWLNTAGLHTTLSQLGVEHKRLPELAAAAAQQWTGIFNPRSVNRENLLAIYEQAF